MANASSGHQGRTREGCDHEAPRARVPKGVRVKRDQPAWRTEEDDKPIGLKITKAGSDAIGVEDDGANAMPQQGARPTASPALRCRIPLPCRGPSGRESAAFWSHEFGARTRHSPDERRTSGTAGSIPKTLSPVAAGPGCRAAKPRSWRVARAGLHSHHDRALIRRERQHSCDALSLALPIGGDRDQPFGRHVGPVRPEIDRDGGVSAPPRQHAHRRVKHDHRSRRKPRPNRDRSRQKCSTDPGSPIWSATFARALSPTGSSRPGRWRFLRPLPAPRASGSAREPLFGRISVLRIQRIARRLEHADLVPVVQDRCALEPEQHEQRTTDRRGIAVAPARRGAAFTIMRGHGPGRHCLAQRLDRAAYHPRKIIGTKPRCEERKIQPRCNSSRPLP